MKKYFKYLNVNVKVKKNKTYNSCIKLSHLEYLIKKFINRKVNFNIYFT